MQKTIGVTEFEKGFGVIFDEVAEQKTPYVLTRNSQPEAVLIPYGEYIRYRNLQDSDLWKRVNDLIARLPSKIVISQKKKFRQTLKRLDRKCAQRVPQPPAHPKQIRCLNG